MDACVMSPVSTPSTPNKLGLNVTLQKMNDSLKNICNCIEKWDSFVAEGHKKLMIIANILLADLKYDDVSQRYRYDDESQTKDNEDLYGKMTCMKELMEKMKDVLKTMEKITKRLKSLEDLHKLDKGYDEMLLWQLSDSYISTQHIFSSYKAEWEFKNDLLKEICVLTTDTTIKKFVVFWRKELFITETKQFLKDV